MLEQEKRFRRRTQSKLAEFWDSHSVAVFDDQLEEVTEPIFDREPMATICLPSAMVSDGEAPIAR